MLHPRLNKALPQGRSSRATRTEQQCARGFTLIELLMALTITSMLSVVLGGLMLAVQTARDHVEGLEEATAQATAATHRMKYLFGHSGVYQLPNSPTVLGIAVVEQRWGGAFQFPDTLVLWCGGREGGLASLGVLPRLPRVNELVIYTPHVNRPHELHEFVFPEDSSEIDFRANDFNSRIFSLLSSTQAESVMICDRLRFTNLGQLYGGSDFKIANARFTLRMTPDESEIQTGVPGTTGWNQMGWSQGASTNASGLRQATLNIELLVERNGQAEAGNSMKPSSLTFFGAASYRYNHEP